MEAQDHRNLIEKLDLAHFEQSVGGVVFWHPRGAALMSALRNWLRRNLLHAGYGEIETPQLMPVSEWERSGHLEFYAAGMFGVHPLTGDIEGNMALKPMNCPGAAAVFRHASRSWRDLPLRFSEFGRCHRMEPSGSMHGLLRLRAFEQDDGHIFCLPEQVPEEVMNFCSMADRAYRALGFSGFSVAMSLRPELRAGSDEQWNMAERLLEEASVAAGLSPVKVPGEGAFYGPKLEFSLRDRAGRSWQCGTIQLDLILPARMELIYTGRDGKLHNPVLLHRALLGSLERMTGIMLEHHGENLPFWLAPEQIAILPVSENHADTACEAAAFLRERNLRVNFVPDAHNHTPRLGNRMRDSIIHGIPAIAVIGDAEKEKNGLTVSIGGVRKWMSLHELANMSEWQAPPIL